MASACGFDGLLGDQFSAQHAKSLPVAFAINDAVAAGVIGKAALAPIEPGQKGYWRAMMRLQRFAELLEATADRDGLPPVSILLIDSQLWTRLRPGPAGYEIEAHALRPAPGDVVIVTNEFVLAGIVEGSLSSRRALDLGVVAVDGDARLATSVQDKMLARIGSDKTPGGPRMARKILAPWGNKAVGSQ
ncbi:hypothetical protein [Methylocystis parvus]|uniref:hypothetical protein n=1 Tax=Methylocystis parvus TaxID=134 RepID=UPI003C767CFA